MQLPFVISLVLLLSANAHAEITDEQINADCAKITMYASQGQALYKAKNYPAARKYFEQQAAWSEDCKANDEKAIATAYNNVALTWMHENQWRKARAWLMLLPQDPKSIYNLQLIKDKLAALPSDFSTTNEYWNYAGKATWNTLTFKLARLTGTMQVDFQGNYFGMTGIYNGPNIGEFSESVTLKNGTGVIVLRDDTDDMIHCNITLKLTTETLDVSTDTPNNCGFGANVSADGPYLRVD
ncbi:tetratricopeptide repeat protein [Escherichia coli]|uniref:tetratricopeptide repeat protein n=1 Tax=Escherichia coli TaxID=562 RepID=UPI001C6FD94A|nr:tetratricopeptide repeat protein [Escherichia coli]MBW9929056.1 tetratricopeptide repeat protein [Escherichia coli]